MATIAQFAKQSELHPGARRFKSRRVNEFSFRVFCLEKSIKCNNDVDIELINVIFLIINKDQKI